MAKPLKVRDCACGLARHWARRPQALGSSDDHLPVGQRRLSSSNQFWTRIISVTGWGFLSSTSTVRDFWPSGPHHGPYFFRKRGKSHEGCAY